MSAGLWIKLLAVAAIGAMVLMGARSCQEYYRDQGRVEVRTKWIDADKQREANERAALIAKQKAERDEEQRMARAAEEKALELSKREEQLRGRAVAAERRVNGLLGQLASLDAASRDRRAEGTCPTADAEANEATKARELLGRCAGRYRDMGERATELASQVMGLQDHLVIAQPEAAALLELAP